MKASIIHIVQVPINIRSNIIAFCDGINSNTPYYVTVKPHEAAEYTDCFWSVKNHKDKHGGEIRFGWNIYEHIGIMLEAEFHAVWQPPQGDPIDITPNHLLNSPRHLFLPENDIVYDFNSDNKRINNRRFALSQHPYISSFFDVLDSIFELEEKYPGREIMLTEADNERYLQLQSSKNMYLLEIIEANKRLSKKRRKRVVKKKKH